MDEHALARLKLSLEQGDSPLIAMQSLLSDGDERLLELACVPRRIDATVLEALGLEPASALRRIRAMGLATRVPGHEGEYALGDTVRAIHYKRRWSSRPGQAPDPELAELSARLAECFERADNPLEALYHRFAFDPASAFAEFHALYREADERFDLPRCRDLLDVLEQRLPELEPAALTLWDEHRAYINARGLWVDDWYRSARFLVPEASRDPIEGLLAGTSRSLQLWARGGLGKTTHIRWLISRRCVPKPERIACARVDFDMIVPSAAVEEPWLVLLELAEQLNAQLPETPFARLLKQFGEHRERLRPGSDPVHALALPDSREGDSAHHDAVVGGFRESLAALGPDERVVVVLDTLEVPLLIGQRPGGRSPLYGLLRDLAAAYDAAPSLRVVLAGRLDLRERVEDFATMFGDCVTLQLTGFTEAEKLRYLTDNRRLKDAAIVRAAARAAGPTPFKLALIADVVEQRPDLSAADIESFTDVDLLYLIKRVVERIDDPLTRWVLRYGVVPRTLDETFVAEVMLPFVAEAASGGREDDLPEDDDLPDRERGDEQPWLTDVVAAEGALDPSELWHQLLKYAGGASWVTVEHAAGREVLRFHPDVLGPMRRLLAGKDVFAKLQRAACAFFEQRAQDDPASSARWQADAVFHRFHLDGPAAAGYWRELIAAASGPEHAERRRWLARDLIDGDYTDDDGQPLQIRDGTPLIASETLLEARFELAWAITQHARHERRPETSSHWSEAQALIRQVSHALESGAMVVDADRYAMALGALLFSTGSLAAARGHVDAALRSRLDPADRLWLVSEYADALAAGGRHPEAEGAYRQALDLGGRGWGGRDRILSRLVRLSWDQDRLEDALGWAQQAVDTAGPKPPPELRTLMAAAQLGSGQAALALATIDEIETSGDDVLVRGELIRARAARRGWRPALALARAERALARLRSEPPGPERGRLIARATEVRGVACAALLDVEGAMAAFGEMAEQRRVADDLAGVCRAHLRRAELLGRELGDLAGADRELSYAEKMGLRSASDRSPLVLLRAEVAGRRGERDEARELVDAELENMRDRGAPPHELVAGLLTRLTLEDGDASGTLGELADALASITPPARRLALLTALRRCPSNVQASTDVGQRLRRTVPSACDGDLPWLLAEDAATLTLADAELDRVLGRPEHALRKLGTVAGAIGDGEAAGVCEWLEAWYRAGGDAPEAAAGPHLRQALDGSVGRPLQHAALSILIASGRLREAEPDRLGGENLLQRASELLGGQPGAGRWQALLQAGLADLARDRGDDEHERIRTLLAADIYRRLGDGAAREQLLKRIGASPASERIDGWLTVSLTTGRGRVNSKLARGDDVVRIRGHRDNRVIRAVFGGTDSIDQFNPATAAIVAGDIDALARDLADVIVGRDADADAEPVVAPGEARLRIPDLALHHLPWEVAVVCDDRLRPLVDDGGPWLRSTLDERLGSEEVRELQSSLDHHVPAQMNIDGILGPDSRAALERFQRAAGLPVTGTPDLETQHHLLAGATARRAVVVRAATGPEARGSLDLRQTREPVEWVYRRHDFETDVIEGLTLAGLGRLGATQPALIHLSGAFVEYEGTAVLDLAGEWEYVENPRTSADSERITPSALSRALHAADARPIVILDPPAPRSRYELALQLMLRNGFAGDLFAHGEVRAVLGLGLARHEAQEEQYELIVGQLAASVTLGSLIRCVHDRSQSPELRRSGHELAFASATLFARTGEIRPPWRR